MGLAGDGQEQPSRLTVELPLQADCSRSGFQSPIASASGTCHCSSARRPTGALPQQPLNSDVGGFHLAFYVDDLDEAVDYLKSRGVKVLGEPTVSGGANEGQRWVYFLAPWGLQFEMVSYPDGKAYEAGRERLLWSPVHPQD